MFNVSLRILIYTLILCQAVLAQNPGRYDGKTNNWYKGNTHCHPDERANPDDVAKLYHDYDFDFLVFTEHKKYLTTADAVFSPLRDSYLIISGEEYDNGGSRHTSVVNSTGKVGSLASGGNGDGDAEFFNRVFDAVAQVSGLPFLNHPTWTTWSVNYDLVSNEMEQITGYQHFENFNGAQDTDNYGIYKGRPSTDKIWDDLLSADKKWYGVASDDFHSDHAIGGDTPFTGWSMVKTGSLTADSIVHAFRVGRFYGTNGIILEDLTTDFGLYKVKIDDASTQFEITRRDDKPYATPAKPLIQGEDGYKIEFIGKDGVILKTITGLEGEYQITSNDPYVRLRVSFTRDLKDINLYANITGQQDYINDNNAVKESFFAWGQPIFSDSRKEGAIAKFGCTDSTHLEYDLTANLSDPEACINQTVRINIARNNVFQNQGGFTLKVDEEFGNYSIEIRHLNGKFHSEIKANSIRLHKFKGLTKFKTYIVMIKGNRQNVFKRITIR